MAARKKRSGKIFVIIAAILILVLIGLFFSMKKDGNNEPEVQVLTIQTTSPQMMHGMLNADDVEWAQASIWKDSAVHLFLTKQQISDIIDAVNALDTSSFEKIPVNSTLTVLLTLSDQDIQLEFDGERVGFLYGEENVSVLDPTLLDILAPIARVG